MSSGKKNLNKKKYIFKGGNIIVSPPNSNNISGNFTNENKKESIKNMKKNPTNIIINNFNYRKQKKNLKQDFVNSNPSFLDLQRQKLSYKNALKINNEAIKKFLDVPTDNIDQFKNFYLNRKNKNNNHKDLSNNFINSSRSHNKSYFGEKKITYDYFKRDILPMKNNNLQKDSKVRNISNLNLMTPKSNFQKSYSNFYGDFVGSGAGLFKRDLPNFKYKSPEKIIDEHASTAHKTKDTYAFTEGAVNQSTNESKNFEKKKTNIYLDKDKKGENISGKGPEEMHWYFIKCIQDGKKLIKKFH